MAFFCARERRNGGGAGVVRRADGAHALAGGVGECAELTVLALDLRVVRGVFSAFARLARGFTSDSLAGGAVRILRLVDTHDPVIVGNLLSTAR